MSILKDKLAKYKTKKIYSNVQKVQNVVELLGVGEQSYVSVITSQKNSKYPSPPLIDIDLIDADPEQPRKVFEKKNLKELSESINIRSKNGNPGVKTPISIRENPEVKGRFIINHGERRWRASKMVNQKTIPAFIDEDHTVDDAIIENVQRDNLTPREIADYIGRQLAKGRKKCDIAQSIGKSNAYISQHSILLDLPESIAEAFKTGRSNDVTAISELVKLYKNNANAVDHWLSNEDQEITRSSVDLLKINLDSKSKVIDDSNHFDSKTIVESLIYYSHMGKKKMNNTKTNKTKEGEIRKLIEEDGNKLKKAIIVVIYDERQAWLLWDRKPSAKGYGWLKYNDGFEFEAMLSKVTILALIESPSIAL